VLVESNCLEALAVDDAGAGLVVLLLGDPHLLEGGQGGQDGATDPDGVLALWGSDDLDLDGGWGQGGDLLLHTIGNTGVHGGATGHDDVSVQELPIPILNPGFDCESVNSVFVVVQRGVK